MCKRSTEELVLNQCVCVFSHRPLFCIASYLQSWPVLILKIQISSVVMPAQTVENTGVIKNFSSLTSERHILMLIQIWMLAPHGKAPCFHCLPQGLK